MQWTKSQKNVVVAAYLGWTLDAFDFFLMVFMFKDIAATFHVDVKSGPSARLRSGGLRTDSAASRP